MRPRLSRKARSSDKGSAVNPGFIHLDPLPRLPDSMKLPRCSHYLVRVFRGPIDAIGIGTWDRYVATFNTSGCPTDISN